MSCDACNSTIETSAVGERWDHSHRKGATWGPFSVTVENPDGSLVDFTGCTIRGAIKKKSSDAALITFTATIANQTTNRGKYSFEVAANQFAALSAGLKPSDLASRYVWGLELVDASNRVIPLYFGVFTLTQNEAV